ncbi:MAG: endolytic transglycosylase MltG [Deltaproteobacteria bacterium]|nr:endolytic transglycosylase MltG [Deltaproteobacteria bacterium]
MAFIENKKRFFFFCVGLIFLLAVFVVMGFGYYLMSPARKTGNQRLVQIREGATLREVAGSLEKNGVIKNRFLFVVWGRCMGYGRAIKAGEYLLSPTMSPLRVFGVLVRGVGVTHPVTIPEGYNRKQIARLLDEKEITDGNAFLRISGDAEVAREYGLSGQGLEGYLYPDTYRFRHNMEAGKVIDVMVRRFWEVLAPYKETIKKSHLSLEQVVTLASIVEKETGRAEERPKIASVFLNRLRKKMRLESDPTVIYGLASFSGNLTKKDLERPTRYNTYVIRGLPPGPIASPGIEAIKAVLFPARSGYLYFVSKNDGTHHFSRTLEEHNRAVTRYQKRRHIREKQKRQG